MKIIIRKLSVFGLVLLMTTFMAFDNIFYYFIFFQRKQVFDISLIHMNYLVLFSQKMIIDKI